MHAQQLTAADTVLFEQGHTRHNPRQLLPTFDIWLLLEQLHGAGEAQRKQASGPFGAAQQYTKLRAWTNAWAGLSSCQGATSHNRVFRCLTNASTTAIENGVVELSLAG